MTQNAPVHNVKWADFPINVGLPNGMQLQAHKICTLPLESVPPEAKEAYMVQGIDKNLISIGKLCDAGCEAIFTAEEVGIYENK